MLVEGLPDWRSYKFYFRRMRKIGLVESLAYLFVIVTIFQYFINWAAYWEKKFTLSEAVSTQVCNVAQFLDLPIYTFLASKHITKCTRMFY